MGAACAVAANIQDADASIVISSTITNLVSGATETEVVVPGRKAAPTTEVGVQTDKVIVTSIGDPQVPSPDFFSSGSFVNKLQIMPTFVSLAGKPVGEGLVSLAGKPEDQGQTF